MTGAPVIAIIDDHDSIRNSLRALLESADFVVRDYASAIAFLEEDGAATADCLVTDVHMPKMSGLELREELNRRGVNLAMIVVTGHGDVPLAVRAMKAGVLDFLEKPFDDEMLLDAIRHALSAGKKARASEGDVRAAVQRIELLTEREREVFDHLVLGKSNKLIAHTMGISPRTVEFHRARVQEKLNARALSDLVRIARTAGQLDRGQTPST